MKRTMTQDGQAAHLKETTASACDDGALDEPAWVAVTALLAALAVLALLAAVGGVLYGARGAVRAVVGCWTGRRDG